MNELKLMKIITPGAEVVFLGNEPLKDNRLRTPTGLGNIIPLDRVLRRAGGFSPRLQALRVLGYKDSEEYPNGLLIATTRENEVRRVFDGHIALPQDEMCDEVFANTINKGDPDLTYLRIERIRLEIHLVTPDQLDELRGSI